MPNLLIINIFLWRHMFRKKGILVEEKHKTHQIYTDNYPNFYILWTYMYLGSVKISWKLVMGNSFLREKVCKHLISISMWEFCYVAYTIRSFVTIWRHFINPFTAVIWSAALNSAQVSVMWKCFEYIWFLISLFNITS